MKRKRGVSSFLLLLLGILLLQPPGLGLSANPTPPAISAQTAALIDVQSGRILLEKNSTKRMRIASLTKIMTAIVAIEHGNINDMVKTSNNAFGKEGSSIYLKRGEKLRLEDMLYGLMLRSGNDAAVAIAEHVGGSVEGFAHLMNEKARYIGMTSSHFTNPHGLDDSNTHYSTARDMAVLTAYALRNPVFKKIVSTKVKNIPNQGEEWDRRLLNKNKMLRMYQGADGVKTGYTKLAKRCLASSATRNGQQLAVVVLNAPDDWDDCATWMDYGFSHFPKTELLKTKQAVQEKGAEGKEKTLYTTRSFSYPLRPEEKESIKMNVKTVDDKPMMEVKLGEQIIGRVPLEDPTKTKETMQLTLANRLKNQWHAFWQAWLGVLSDG